MEDWRIKDNKIICYNLQHKLTPFKARVEDIDKEVARIKKQNKCDELEATIILKKELKQKVAEYERNTRTDK